jgi:hypothetical protein
MQRTWKIIAALTAAALGLGAQVIPAVAADPAPPFIPADAPWLTTINYYRAMSGMPPVVENPTLSSGAYNHSCYMLYNGIAHDEIPGKPGYSASGDAAGNNGNIAVSSAFGTSHRSHIELWMTGPFHAIGILRHSLQSVGYGKCDLNNTPIWHSGATLNVLNGIGTAPRPTTPTLFPGNGTTTNLNQFVTESPNPLAFCGWSGSAGLPVIAMMPEAVTTTSGSMTGPNGPVQTCSIFSGNTSGAAQAILAGDNAVSVIPRNPLGPGTYTTTITTQARTVTWSFTVDPTASTGVMPIPTVSPAGPASGYTAVTPFRFADSRINSRVTRLLSRVPKRIKVAGVAGLPADITAISANFTVTEPTSGTFLTVYNCATVMPTASTLNFGFYETVANAGIFPLSSAGEICVYSPANTELIIDISGHFRPSVASTYNALTPVPLVNTLTRLGAASRLAAGSTLSVNVVNANVGVPSNATAVALNISGVTADATGFITAFPCGITMPVVSNVNPLKGMTKSNFAIVPLSPSGELCLYTRTALDLKVDVLGYLTGGGTGTIVPSAPTRVTDTRDAYRSEMNLGTGGQALAANTPRSLRLAGNRGIPGNAKAVSVNVTIVSPAGNGTLTVWGCGTQPGVDSISFPTGKIVANGIQVKLSATGDICMNSTVATHLVIDVTGWWN